MSAEQFRRITRISDLEAVDKLLFVGIVFFTIVMVGISKWSPNDGQTFQVLSGLLTGFGAAFFARMKPSSRPTDAQSTTDKPNSVT